jgi:hypothetical protein
LSRARAGSWFTDQLANGEHLRNCSWFGAVNYPSMFFLPRFQHNVMIRIVNEDALKKQGRQQPVHIRLRGRPARIHRRDKDDLAQGMGAHLNILPYQDRESMLQSVHFLALQ